MKTKCFLTSLVFGCFLVNNPVWSQIIYNVNWEETFDNNALDLPTWQFIEYPDWDFTPTSFQHPILDGPADDDYIQLADTLGVNSGGSAFGMAMGDPNDLFTDVRVGATVNINGDASWGHHLIGARSKAFPSSDLGDSKPGHLVNGYVLHVNYEEGPANLVFELEKVYASQEIMRGGHSVSAIVPGLDHKRGYYAEMDVVGTDPTYVSCALYESKGGSLILQLPVLVDTNVQDPWEEKPGSLAGVPNSWIYPVFSQGASGIGGANEDENPIKGYTVTFDDVSSKHDNGPAAVGIHPPNGATDVAWDATLQWVEPSYATGREFWFGPQGSMRPIDPTCISGTSYVPDKPLQAGQTYEWRVDVIGSTQTVVGHVQSFTTKACIVIDDFESYPLDSSLRLNWDPNEGGTGNVYLEIGNDFFEGAQAMRLEYNNNSSPFFKEVTRKFETPQDWAANTIVALTFALKGDNDNAQQPLYVRIEDNNGVSHEATSKYLHAVQTDVYRELDIELGEFADNGVDMTQVKKLTFGVGNKTSSPEQDGMDEMYIDFIRLYQPRCLNPDNVDLRGDANGDCRIDLFDLAILANGWLKEGWANSP